VKKYFKALCSSMLILSTIPSIAEEVSVLVLYTDAAENIVAGGAIEDRVEAYIDASNDSYLTSGVNITLTLAESRLVTGVDDSRNTDGDQNYDTGTALRNLTDGIGVFSNVRALRDTFGADFVVLLRDIQDTGGLGWVDNTGNGENIAYSVVRIQNPLSSFTHELGHNMGLAHSRRQVEDGGVRGIEPHAAGYGVDRDDTPTSIETGFVTIMAYNSSFNNAPSLDVISNPDILCDSGTSVQACGIDESDADEGADATRVLNDRLAEYSGYRVAPTVDSVTFDDINLSGCAEFSQDILIPNFTNFDCVNQNVKSLTGIESLTALTSVNFQDNDIFSLQPLFDLPNLEGAILSGNNRAICSDLTQLEQKLGAGSVVRPNECFPLVAILVAINSLLL
jgi:hypothetical protein